ncbi:CRISPR-associated protein Csm4 [Candidatus Nitrotoga sp. BS]|uniref:type III-A CRISPR-associated RAMP protein Csm4 n=1 Tax=Candidatus Nitrotoga sp. BS TaxID=2890408 RepID=UPI001EF1929B|nr:hypothetical protein [Candidatus Nitrotoga sp. BS]CAH1191510.1 CRISPR-associated protein Csm4 [Candidatus Nitrotoga sp. BS]
MRTYRASITPLSAFGTLLLGDTLFGQLCWAIRNRYGEQRLDELLDGYTNTISNPFVVVSDAFPSGFLPRPALPSSWFDEIQGEDRKAVKRLTWLPISKFHQPVAQWLNFCQPAAELFGSTPDEHPQPHNTLDRITGTTGTGQFVPYVMSQSWFGEKDYNDLIVLDIYLIFDETRITADELRQLFEDIGNIGFGRDASIGLGKYAVQDWTIFELPSQINTNSWMTLAPSAPQDLCWNSARCFYQTFTRFGRHGDVAVHGKNPFKTPLLLTVSGAVLTPQLDVSKLGYIGQGLGGSGKLSRTIEATVHQGYAPVVGIYLPDRKVCA